MHPGKLSNLSRLLLRTGFSSSSHRLLAGSSPSSQVAIGNAASSLAGAGSGCGPSGACAAGGTTLTSSCYQPQSFLLGGVRFYFTKKPNNKVAKKDPEGIKYPGFTYFPRFPGEKDPPVEPTKLFLVKRIRSLYGCPYWEKKWIMELKLEDRRSCAIIKNTPANNARLYRVKHLIEVIPIKTPDGMPDKPENGFLKENGDYITYNLLGQHGAPSVEECEKMIEDYFKGQMDGTTLRIRLHKRWYDRHDVV